MYLRDNYGILQAGFRPNPELSVDAQNLPAIQLHDVLQSTEATVSIAQRLEIAGKRSLRLKNARIYKDSAALSLDREVDRRSRVGLERRGDRRLPAAGRAAPAGRAARAASGEHEHTRERGCENHPERSATPAKNKEHTEAKRARTRSRQYPTAVP